MWRWIASRLFAARPFAPLAVTIDALPGGGGVVITWTRAPGRAGRYNLEREEHAVSVRCVDRIIIDALGTSEDLWMDVYVGLDDSFVLVGIGSGVTLEARVRAENARGASSWVYAPTGATTANKLNANEGKTSTDDDNSEWGSQWRKK